ncbi:unnamed protein product [Phaedon cochleariae]|uniref:Uncharacterized protein n=1 Tax=Phaedon cochleariae TaxID=80249 RepID=A0A9N9SIK6_PHACE|nr:unnamed protein product [Phaedon cochleariae]
MGSSSGGKKKYTTFRSRQRANLSFFIVVVFFGVFGVIVFTEIFFIDERGRAGGGVLSEDYISIRVGAAMMNDDSLGALLMGGRPPVALPVIENNVAPVAPKLLILDKARLRTVCSNESWLNALPAASLGTLLDCTINNHSESLLVFA